VQVTLTVAALPPVSVSTTSLTFNYRAGDQVPATQQVQVTGGSAVAFTASASSSGWLGVTPLSGTTPGTLNVSITPGSLGSGTYNGTITVTATGNAPLVIAVSLTVTAPLPTITRVTNAASYAQGSVSPGLIVTLFGTNMAGSSEYRLTLDATGKVATTAGTVRVLFSGIAGPLVYVSASQISAIVPYEVAGRSETTVQVEYLGARSNGVSLIVTTAAPGLFTLNSSGTGPGAILNADNSVNTPNNPIAKGGVVVVFGTGEGLGFPAAVTGGVTGSNPSRPLLPVAATIDGQPAQVQYAGAAPGLVAGAFQMNLVVPPTVSSGKVGVVVSFGSANSQSNVTVSVR
jgi:uncharacterized protein (TIGR03437 family)